MSVPHTYTRVICQVENYDNFNEAIKLVCDVD
jgi:hypothetical protein